MNLFEEISQLVKETLKVITKRPESFNRTSLEKITIEPPRLAAYGDMATNAALVLTSKNDSPRDLAQELAIKLTKDKRILKAAVAGPGFVNLKLSLDCWHHVLKAILSDGDNFGRSNFGAGKRVNIEFVSANPTGPLHVGHTRGAVFGDALGNLLSFAGYRVTREYYINDAGAQIEALARSVYFRYLQAIGKKVVVDDMDYPGEYLAPVGEALAQQYGDKWADQPEQVWLKEIGDYAGDIMMKKIQEDLASLGVKMDVFFSEKSLYGTGRIEAALKQLQEKGLIYEGILDPPKGKFIEDWERREQTLFKSTEHGDDVDRPLKKSDGTWTYFAPDIAYHFDKIARNFDILIDVLGADHGGYVKRMKAAVSALSDGKVSLDTKLIQLVRLQKNGRPFKMSKRAGSFVTLRDLIETVGAGVTRFVMLTRKNDAPLEFDFDKALEQSRDNPVFYVQYANARVVSIFRRAKEEGIPITDDMLRNADLSVLNHEMEIAVLRKLAEWPRAVEMAARSNEPHKIAFFLNELAGEFHRLWNLGSDDSNLRFIQPNDIPASQSKIALVRAVSIVISSGLGILGVTPLQEMR
ncbi:MAG: arginine--tRNA ligase [Aestuariivita sp.]|nr:arginine--tRNA ligase [Aestuariivita sp.]